MRVACPAHFSGALLTVGSLLILARVAYDFPKIGQEFMLPLDELTMMYMPVTVPRAGITQVADDLKTKASLPTQVVTVGEGDAATYHVFVGKFSTHAAAEAAATRLLAKGLVQQGAVTPLPKTP